MQARLSGERHVIERDSPLYPALLRDLDGAPDEIYVLGNPEALARESVSIIGARRATPYGIACAQLAARVAAEFDLQVVSGAAIGCDQAAQREALARGACSVAVLGGGANVVYPSNAEDLLRDILATDGALLSLSRWDAPPLRHTFVRRNPVIAALSRALVICEAGVPSGTFSTAEAAERIGRSVLVFPGSFFSPNSRGSNFLLASSPTFMPLWDEDSLRMATSTIYERLAYASPPGGRRPLTGEAQGLDGLPAQVFDALVASPESPESLAAALGTTPVATMRALGDLAARGLVERLMDGRYSPTQSVLASARGRGRQRGSGE